MEIKYKTITEQRKYSDKVFILEVIRNLDEAIDQLCELVGDRALAEELCPYFGNLWPSAEGLSQYLEAHPDLIRKKRVLEIGSGMGLPSLVAKHLGAEVLTTDFHPDVESYFKRNCWHSSLEIPFMRLDWREPPKELAPFDVVIGSDVLYEKHHPAALAAAFLPLVKKDGLILIADPGRSYLQDFYSEMEKLGYVAALEEERVRKKEDIFIMTFKRT